MTDQDPQSPTPESQTDSQSPPRPRSRFRTYLILAIIAIGAGIYYYEEIYEERYVVTRFGTVEDGYIYRSSKLPAAVAENVFRNNEIDVVVDLTSVVHDDKDQQAETLAVEALDILRYRIPMRGDGVGTPRQYANAVAAIHRARASNQTVLVHCHAGAQRTGGIVSAYRLLVLGDPTKDVYRDSMRYDWEPHEDTAWPIFLNKHMARIAGYLVDDGVIDKVPEPLPVFGPG